MRPHNITDKIADIRLLHAHRAEARIQASRRPAY